MVVVVVVVVTIITQINKSNLIEVIADAVFAIKAAIVAAVERTGLHHITEPLLCFSYYNI